MTDKIESIGLITEDITDILRNDTKEVKDNLRDNYYNKTDIRNMLRAGITTVVVNELPQVGEERVVYLVPVESSMQGEHNLYKEYIYAEINGSYRWEILGDTSINLNNYYNKTETDALLDGKMDADTFIPSKISEITNDKGYAVLREVAELPVTATEGTIYIVPASTVYEQDNAYDEYIWINGAWEKFGYPNAITHEYVNSNYYKKEEVYGNDDIEDAIDTIIDLFNEN